MSSLRLTVPYESQLDNQSGTGWRECFSSSAAMLCRFWGAIGSDDSFNNIRARYGDSTNPQAQLAAIRSLGLKSHFWTNGRQLDLERELRAGRPVAVGFLHQGPIRSPQGGHWGVLVGLEPEGFRLHDPFGEPMLLTGGHLRGSSGKGVLCSWRNFLPRWEVEGPRSGWYLTACR